jgi:hypothetical protein
MSCRQKVFAERFGEDVLAPWARRTAQLNCLVHQLGLALGGRPAASFARRLMLYVSNDILLRVVWCRTRASSESLSVVRIDDCAYRCNCRCGTIVCDLERRRGVELLQSNQTALRPRLSKPGSVRKPGQIMSH